MLITSRVRSRQTWRPVLTQLDCGTRILRVISRAGRPCHFSKLHQHLARMQLCDSIAVVL